MRLAHPQQLGARPLVVIAAGKRSRPPGLSDSTWAAMQSEKEVQHRELTTLSSNSRFVLDSTSGHGIPTDNPALVARAIIDVVNAVRTHKPLR
jgi:hypothetical protein